MYRVNRGCVQLIILSMLMCGCGSKDAKQVWDQGLKKCAASDLLGPNILYFGPSNALGPGTVFQKFADGGLQPSHLLSQYGTTSLYAPAQTFQCSAVASSSFKLNANATLPSVIPVNGTVAGSISTATNITVNAQSLEWDQLVTGPYKALVLGFPDSNPVKSDLLNEHQLVLSRALRVSGMSAVVEFTHDNGVNAKANIPNGPIAGAGLSLDATWTGDTKLTITAPADFYIAGELRTFSVNGLAGGSRDVGSVVDPKGLYVKK